MDYSPPGSSIHGILQARILEWVAIISEEKIEKKLSDIDLDNDFLDMITKAQATKTKINKMFLHSKRNSQQNVKATYGMGENICKSYIR